MEPRVVSRNQIDCSMWSATGHEQPKTWITHETAGTVANLVPILNVPRGMYPNWTIKLCSRIHTKAQMTAQPSTRACIILPGSSLLFNTDTLLSLHILWAYARHSMLTPQLRSYLHWIGFAVLKLGRLSSLSHSIRCH